MTLKKIKVIGAVSIIVLSFLFHFAYTTFPNFLTSLFFPVNESIWEHMKLFFISALVYSIIDYILLKKNNIKFNNFFLQLFVTSVLSFIIYLIVYLPLYNIFHENMFISIGLLILVIILGQIVSYFLLKQEELKILNLLSIILLPLIFLVFAYLTYNPIKNYVFFDIQSEKYGIDIYE